MDSVAFSSANRYHCGGNARSGFARMFSSVLIANRGEIAVRVARTARRMGLRTIAVYSPVDANALHVRLCDEAHALGPAGYLAADKLMAVAKQAGAGCIHPGYGFLSENPDFAEARGSPGGCFVRPAPGAVRPPGVKEP